MTMNTGETTAPEGTPSGGASSNQPSEAEVTKLRSDLEASTTLITTRDAELVTLGNQVTELQTANTKFADDVAGLASQTQQLKDAQSALEESRKTSTELQTQLETANTTNTGLQESMMSSRRQDLMSKYGLPEERVADLDDAGLKVLESTLPHVPSATPNGTKPTGSGYGLDGGGGTMTLAPDSAIAGATKLIEKLKSPN